MQGEILSNLFNITLFGIVKWLAVAGLVMYVAFSVVIVKQVGIMSEAVDAGMNGVIKVFAWAHLAMAVLLLIAAIVIL